VRRVTPGQGNLTESGTENIPPAASPVGLGGVVAPIEGASHSPKCTGLVVGKGEKVR